MAAPKGNKFAIGNSGKPKKWVSPEALQQDINNYFAECNERTIKVYDKKEKCVIEIDSPIPYTIEGLCETLDCDRTTLLAYQKETGYEVYFGIIKRAKLKCQRNKIERALMGDSNPAVSIFDLKNNHGYKDKTETDITSDGQSIVPTIVFQKTDG